METQLGPRYARVCDEVAILPFGVFANEVREINVRAAAIQIADGKQYAKSDGSGLVSHDYILSSDGFAQIGNSASISNSEQSG